jgi:hypothetical protein
MPEPNWILMTLLKNTWKKGGQTIADLPDRAYFDTKWYTGANEVEIHVRPLSEKVKRWGVGSTKRPHWTICEVWIWTRDIKMRWTVLKELERILALKAIKPTQDIERIDYWNVDYWQDKDPIGAGELFRAKIDVQLFWVK